MRSLRALGKLLIHWRIYWCSTKPSRIQMSLIIFWMSFSRGTRKKLVSSRPRWLYRQRRHSQLKYEWLRDKEERHKLWLYRQRRHSQEWELSIINHKGHKDLQIIQRMKLVRRRYLRTAQVEAILNSRFKYKYSKFSKYKYYNSYLKNNEKLDNNTERYHIIINQNIKWIAINLASLNI